MMRLSKKCLSKSFLIMSLMVLLVSITAMTFGMTVSADGVTKNLETQVVDGRSFISTDSVNQFGLSATVAYNKITLSNNKVTIKFNVGTNEVWVNDVPMTLDAKAFVDNGEAYVPLKFVFETLNYNVGWSSKMNQVTLNHETDDFFPLTITDQGVSYTFAGPVDTVVSMAPSVTETLFAIGAGDMVLGRTLYDDYPAEVKDIQSIGSLYEPDLESIIDLEPQVAIAATHMNEDAMKTLKTAGIQTLTQKTPEDIAGIYDFINDLGQLTGHDYEARALVSSLKAKEDRVNHVVAMIPKNKIKTGYYVVGTGSSGEFTAGEGTFINEVLKTAGVNNVAKDVEGWSYSLEKLIDHNPQIIITEQFAYDTMKSEKAYSSLQAIQKGNVIVVDGNVYSRPGPRVIDQGLKIIIHALYPEYESALHY